MEQVQRYLATHQPDYLDDLRALVSIDSGSDHKVGVDRVVDWLLTRLTALGFRVERQSQPVLGDNIRDPARTRHATHLVVGPQRHRLSRWHRGATTHADRWPPGAWPWRLRHERWPVDRALCDTSAPSRRF